MKRIFITLCSITFLLLNGCSMPVMELDHTASVEDTYGELGTIEITEFVDERPDDERNKGQKAWNSLSGQVWSGDTEPTMMAYFQNVLSVEAERTGLFAGGGAAEYKLSGR